MDTDSPAYRYYAERLIRHIVAHYKDNPNVIGWQIDNETSSYDASNPDVFIGFQHYLEKKFITPEARKNIGCPQMFFGLSDHNPKNLVAYRMSELVIHELEVVKVHVSESKGMLISLGAVNFHFQQFHE